MTIDLPVTPPVRPMLAKPVAALPRDGFCYEPKWDGFRALAFRSGDEMVLQSRNLRPLGRYFPEILQSLGSLRDTRYVLDGEIMAIGRRGFDFPALLQRLHPARSRVEQLAEETPAVFVAFDLLANGADLRSAPFEERRSRLEGLLSQPTRSSLLSPLTDEADVAAGWLGRFHGKGIDGVIARDPRAPYLEGERSLLKVKQRHTAECVVGGFRWHADEPTVGSLLLGLFDEEGRLRHVGLATGFGRSRRHSLLREVAPHATDLEAHPWEKGFRPTGGAVARLPGTASSWGDGEEANWVPLRPQLVCEVSYDRFEAGRFRHACRFLRWRPDRDPLSCTFEQFPESLGDPLVELVLSLRS